MGENDLSQGDWGVTKMNNDGDEGWDTKSINERTYYLNDISSLLRKKITHKNKCLVITSEWKTFL